MHLSKEQLAQMREIIVRLYAGPFDKALALAVTQGICRLVDSHYSSFYLLAPSRRSRPFTVSNNPPGYLPVYFSVSHEDFLLDSIVSTHQEYVVCREPHRFH